MTRIAPPAYPIAKTRKATLQVSGHFPAEHVKAFHILATEHNKDVQELLAEGMNMIFERYHRPNWIPLTSGRRTRPRRK